MQTANLEAGFLLLIQLIQIQLTFDFFSAYPMGLIPVQFSQAYQKKCCTSSAALAKAVTIPAADAAPWIRVLAPLIWSSMVFLFGSGLWDCWIAFVIWYSASVT